MTQREKKQLALDVAAELEKIYPNAECALEYGGEPWKLLVMSRLSAQCTDKKVNIVSRPLFERYPTPEKMAEADIRELEELVRPCGLYRMKAKNIKDSLRILVDEHGGVLPSDMDLLLALPGVGRKIANLLRGDIFGLGGIVTDTHFIRICGRLGFYSEREKNPAKIEKLFTPLLPPELHTDFCHRIVWFGREYCSSQSPKCTECPLSHLCNKAKKEQKQST